MLDNRTEKCPSFRVMFHADCVDYVVLGCALQGKKELRILRDLFPDIDLSPDDTGDDHTASTDGPKGNDQHNS